MYTPTYLHHAQLRITVLGGSAIRLIKTIYAFYHPRKSVVQSLFRYSVDIVDQMLHVGLYLFQQLARKPQ